MTLAHTVRMYLDQNQIPYELLSHRHSRTSLRTADRAHIEPARLAKGVLLEDDLERQHFLMAVLPATHQVSLADVARCVGRPVHLATEEDAAGLFADCETGAIPPVGTAYGVETIWEDGLAEQPDLYFEAGDHEGLVHVQTPDFIKLMGGCPHGQFGGGRA